MFAESIAQENSGAIAPNQLHVIDAIAPENASSLNHQTALSDLSDLNDPTAQHDPTDLSDLNDQTDLSVQTDLSDPTDPTVPTVPTNLSDPTDQTAESAQTVQSAQHDPTDPTDPTEPNLDDDEKLINVDSVEENWLPLLTHLIDQYCLPSEILDVLHETDWLYANDDGMAVFSLRTLEDLETGVWVFDPETEDSGWLALPLEPEFEKCVNGKPAFFFIHPQDSELIKEAIITSDPIEAISKMALDGNFASNNTIYIGTESVDLLPKELLDEISENVVVSFKDDEDGDELANKVLKALPNSQKIELDEAGWNGFLQERSHSSLSEAEQIQLMTQYQSQQESEMEL